MFATKDIKLQLKEYFGKQEEGKYHNPRYEDLMKKLVVYRKEFPLTKDITARKQLAKEEFDLWYKYLIERREDLRKPDFEIEDKDLALFKETFDRQKVRIKSGLYLFV
jgi:hypothetical protein